MKTILGIDPGLRHTGWGVIQTKNNELKFIASGTIKTNDKASICQRLGDISAQIKSVLEEYDPDEVGIEESFVNQNGQSTLKLGQARGAIIATVANFGLEVAEYAPRLVKKSIVGSGSADKNQMMMMIKTLLPTSTAQNEHEADALAIAICHGNHAT